MILEIIYVKMIFFSYFELFDVNAPIMNAVIWRL